MKKIDSLNLVPFIDIMLVLLVIVLVSASFSFSSKIPIDVPQVDNQTKSNVEQKNISISMDKTGNIFVNDEMVDMKNLQNYLNGIDKDTNVIIKPDKDISVQNFMGVFSILQNLSLSKVFIEVKEN